MNNVTKFSYIYFPYSNDILLITVVGKLLFKFIFYYKYPKAPKYALQNNVELHFINYLEKEFAEVLLKDESLLSFAPTNYGCDFYSNWIFDENLIPMKHPWEVVCSYFIDFFESGKIIQGISVENEVFVVNNSVVKIDKTFRLVSNSLDIVFNCLIKKFMNLLYCSEIIDLLIEKQFLKQLNMSTKEQSNYVILERNSDNCSEKNCQLSQRTESITSLTIMSSDKIILNCDKFSNGNVENATIVPRDLCPSKIKYQPTGDVQPYVNFNETKFTINSRINKAKNWIKNNENHIEKNDSLNNIFCNKKLVKNKKFKQPKQKNPVEKIKLPRYIVRKSELAVKNSTNNSSTNLANRKKPPKTRFTVLKGKSHSSESPMDNRKNKNVQKNRLKSNKNMKLRNPNILSSIRQDVLNLANELHQNYLKRSKSILTKTNSSKPANIENDHKILKKNLLLDEVRKRLHRQPVFKMINEPLIEKDIYYFQKEDFDTLHGLKSINSKKQDSFGNNYESTLSLLSSSDNPFTSSFLTTLDNSITGYKSIESSSQNSPCLKTCDLRDIHQISDQIHGLAQRELLRF